MKRIIAVFAAIFLTTQGHLTSQEIVPAVVLPVVPVLVEPDTPPEPVPSLQVIDSLKPDQWYVVESTRDLIAMSSPPGIVDIEKSEGPIKVRGLFADGSGRTETRTYRSSYVYFVSAVKNGNCELILVPVGVSSESDIVRQVLTVSGIGPRPGPDPVVPDPVVPTPGPTPGPVTSFRVIFVKESGSTLNAEQTAIPGAKEIREYLNVKTTQEGGSSGWREYDPQQTTANEPPTLRALWEAVKPKLLPAPCMVIEVNGHATVMPFPANAVQALDMLKKAGG